MPCTHCHCRILSQGVTQSNQRLQFVLISTGTELPKGLAETQVCELTCRVYDLVDPQNSWVQQVSQMWQQLLGQREPQLQPPATPRTTVQW